MSISNIDLFDFKVADTTYSGLIEHLQDIKSEQFCHIVTLNPEIIIKSREQKELKSWIQHADLCVPDGIGLVWAAKWLKRKAINRITGIGLVQTLLKQSSFSFYFVGATPPVVDKTVLSVKKQYPNISIKGFHHGYINETDQKEVINDIREKNPDVILVGMGFPKQEYFINTLKDNGTKGICVGVGGVFDVLSGEQVRAPKFFQSLGLEWIFRGLIDPKRIKRWGFIQIGRAHV